MITRSIRPESRTWSSLSHGPCEKTGSAPRSRARSVISSTSKPVTRRRPSVEIGIRPSAFHVAAVEEPARFVDALHRIGVRRGRGQRAGEHDQGEAQENRTGQRGKGPGSEVIAFGGSDGRPARRTRKEGASQGSAEGSGSAASDSDASEFSSIKRPHFIPGAYVPVTLSPPRSRSSRPLLDRRSAGGSGSPSLFMISIHSSTIWHSSAYTAVSSSPWQQGPMIPGHWPTKQPSSCRPLDQFDIPRTIHHRFSDSCVASYRRSPNPIHHSMSRPEDSSGIWRPIRRRSCREIGSYRLSSSRGRPSGRAAGGVVARGGRVGGPAGARGPGGDGSSGR